MTHDPGHPPPDRIPKPLSQATLDHLADPAERLRIQQADELLERLRKARARHLTWSTAVTEGKPTEIKLAEVELAAAERELADAELEYQTARGDPWPVDEDAPMMAPSAPGSAEPEPASTLPWWQMAYNIPELAQNIGARLNGQHRRPSNAAIAKEIEIRINELERSKGRDRQAPNWDTIRGVLTGWKWKPHD